MDSAYEDGVEMEDDNDFDKDGSLGQIAQSSISADPDQARKVKKLK